MQGEAAAQQLEEALRADHRELTAINRNFERVTANCTSCHQKFRDVPLSEKAGVN
jgi:cytochrome c556